MTLEQLRSGINEDGESRPIGALFDHWDPSPDLPPVFDHFPDDWEVDYQLGGYNWQEYSYYRLEAALEQLVIRSGNREIIDAWNKMATPWQLLWMLTEDQERKKLSTSS